MDVGEEIDTQVTLTCSSQNISPIVEAEEEEDEEAEWCQENLRNVNFA